MKLIEPDRQKMNSVCSALLSACFPNLIPLTRAAYKANTSPGVSPIIETTLLGTEDRERDKKLHLFDRVLSSLCSPKPGGFLCLSEPFSSLNLFIPCRTSCRTRGSTRREDKMFWGLLNSQVWFAVECGCESSSPVG